MHVLATSGSMRRGRSSETLARIALDAACEILPGSTAEIVRAGELRASPCRVVCSDVCTSPPFLCAVDDDVPSVLAKMAGADGVLLVAPQYFRAPPAAFHTLVERLTSIAFFQESRACAAPLPLLGKPCGLIAVAEYSSPQFILEYLRDAALLLKMQPIAVPGFPYFGVGGHGDIDKDEVFRPRERARELGLALAGAIQRA